MISFKSRQWFQGKEKLIASINQRPGRPYTCFNNSIKKLITPVVEGASYSLHVKFCKNSNSSFREEELCDIVTMTYDAIYIAVADVNLVWAQAHLSFDSEFEGCFKVVVMTVPTQFFNSFILIYVSCLETVVLHWLSIHVVTVSCLLFDSYAICLKFCIAISRLNQSRKYLW